MSASNAPELLTNEHFMYTFEDGIIHLKHLEFGSLGKGKTMKQATLNAITYTPVQNKKLFSALVELSLSHS